MRAEDTHNQNPQDEQLVADLRAGDDDAITDRLADIRRKLVRVARAILRDQSEAEDMAQAAIFKFVDYVRKVDTEIRNPEALATTIVRNFCIGRIRQKSRIRVAFSINGLTTGSGAPIQLAAEVALPCDRLEVQERVGRLREAMGELKPRQQAVLRELFWRGKTQEEVARGLNVTVRTIYNLREKALGILTRRLRGG